MAYQDKSLSCVDCSKPFVFSAGEQEFYAQRGYTNEPKRCPDCRQSRKASKFGGGGGGGGGYGGGGRGGGGGGPRQLFETTCAGCGGKAMVPFQPRLDKPVYCDDCFRKNRGSH